MTNTVPGKKSKSALYLQRTWQLYLMLLLPIAYFILFKYVPIANARLAFLDYNMFTGINGSTWNNFANFNAIFTSPEIGNVIKNTLVLNVLDLIFGFPLPIIIALILNEIKSTAVKNFTQTIIYIPYFLSWVIISGIVLSLFSSTGALNNFLVNVLHTEQISVLGKSASWIMVYIGSGLWQGAGYGTIIYLAALSCIDETLYEAAYVDGAGRWCRVWHVTLPCIKSTIVMMLILSTGNLFSISFDRPYLLGNSLVQNVCDVISTYVYRIGLQGGSFAYATAVGLAQSVVAFILLVTVNKICKKLGEEGIM